MRFIEKPIDTEELLLMVAKLLTQGAEPVPEPLGEAECYNGYRERLEHKLCHRSTQIARNNHLLDNLPSSQRPAFEALLQQGQHQREEIQMELNEIHHILNEYKRKQG